MYIIKFILLYIVSLYTLYCFPIIICCLGQRLNRSLWNESYSNILGWWYYEILYCLEHKIKTSFYIFCYWALCNRSLGIIMKGTVTLKNLKFLYGITPANSARFSRSSVKGDHISLKVVKRINFWKLILKLQKFILEFILPDTLFPHNIFFCCPGLSYFLA